jgi:hypothetical protein
MLPSDGSVPQMPDTSNVAGNAIQFANTELPSFTVWGLDVYPTYWQAATILLLIFLLIFTLARMRYLYVHWHLSKTSLAMMFWGFVLTIILEGFLWLGGRTVLTTVLGWKNPPKPVATTLETGREHLREVLGETAEIDSAKAEAPPTYQSVVFDYKELNEDDKQFVQKFVCTP